MAVYIDIEKKFRGFHLKVKLESTSPTIGILGASGSGKSMTLRCIAGIETPDRGKIIINGKTVYDSEKGICMKPQKRRIGYLFQNYALFPTMTVQDNIGCGFVGDKAERKARVEEYLKRYRLEGLEKRYPSQLSGGQQQRVALARMMIGEPDMILLDEPFSALDGHLKDIVQRDMQEFLEGYGGDMMMVTHSRDEAFRFCQEIMLLKDGTPLISGKTRELFEQPRLLEAARLTGCKNYSAVQKIDDHHVYAVDWGIPLRTVQTVTSDIAYVAIRGHWMRPAREQGENCLLLQVKEYIETTFEHQYLVTNPSMEDSTPLWWMRAKSSFGENPGDGLPPYLYLPPEHLMLLREK